MPKRLLCEHLPTPKKPVLLSESEGHHATRVLRLRQGDVVEVLDGKGGSALAILRVKGESTQIEFLEEEGPSPHTGRKAVPFPIHLELAVLKGEAMEWAIEKAVELNVKSLTPVLTTRSVVQIKQKSPEFFKERWQRIADQALKQCGRLQQLEIQTPVSLDALLQASNPPAIRLWCDERSSENTLFLANVLHDSGEGKGPYGVLIGPEGGWSDEERHTLSSFHSHLTRMQRVSLGQLTLRAETAALFAISILVGHIHKVQSG